MLAPGRGAADEMVRSVCARGTPVWGVHRLTPMALAAELAAGRLARTGCAPISGLAREALAAHAARRTRQAAELEAFAPVAAFPGFARALARTLETIRNHGVDPDRLARAGASGRDLARLAAAYRAELERWSLADAAGILHHARAMIDSGVRHPLLDRALLLLDVSASHRRLHEFLAALVLRAPAVMASAPSSDPTALRALESMLGQAATQLDATPVAGSRLERLRRYLFATARDHATPATDAQDLSLGFFSAPGEGRECVEIARRVRDLAAAGTPFDRIAVALRDARRYLPRVEEAFARARIPVYVTRGLRRPHPAGRAFLALLACAAEDLSASRFAEYLSLGEAPASGPASASAAAAMPWVATGGLADQADADQDRDERAGAVDHRASRAEALRTRGWERLLNDAAVVGGRARWTRRLDALAAAQRAQLERPSGAPENENERRHGRERLAQLERLRDFALPIIAQLDELPARATWGRWLELLERLAVRTLRQPEAVLAELAELRTLAEVGPAELTDLRQVLAERLLFQRGEPPARRHGRVFVGTPENLRARSFAVVFLPGLAEGIFPRRAHEDPLLPDRTRRQLDAGLKTQDERFAHERLLLRLAIGAAESQLAVSFPSVDVETGRARVPSFYALDIQRAADGSLPDLAELAATAAEAATAPLGWPAPHDRARAIDAAEYDLASLAASLGAEDAVAHGAGRYLLAANAALARALRRRWQRWHPKLGPMDGLVDPDTATLEALASQRLSARSYSPTALQHYAACPYRFLLHAVHRLRPREQATPLERLDPRTRGSLFHSVQFHLLSQLRAAQRLPVTASDLDAVRALADQQLERLAGELAQRLSPAVPRVWASEIEELRIDLHGWLDSVVENDGRFRPAHFELAFGLGRDGDHDAASRAQPVSVEGALLRGAIDLVEIDRETDTARVTDHKTGLPAAKSHFRVGGGEVLQPLLYSLAAQELLGCTVTGGQLFYCTRRGGYRRRSVKLDEAGRKAINTVLRTIDQALEQGLLPAAPRPNACRLCDYRAVCGPDEQRRLERKIGRLGERLTDAQASSQKRLAPLLFLRRMP